jgi:hypothetical protein
LDDEVLVDLRKERETPQLVEMERRKSSSNSSTNTTTNAFLRNTRQAVIAIYHHQTTRTKSTHSFPELKAWFLAVRKKKK